MTTKNDPTTQLLPIIESNRLQQLDIIRGIAILGILILNIPSFGLPDSLSWSIYGINGQGIINKITWYITDTFFDGNMRGLFCILFGAGIILFSQQCEKNNRGAFPLYRRMLWLFLFGLFDIFILLWGGDILCEYAICGLVLIPLRKLKPKYLIGIMLIVFSIGIIDSKNGWDDFHEKHSKYLNIYSTIKSKEKLTKDQKEIKKNWENISSSYLPLSEDKLIEVKTNIKEEIQAKQSNYPKSFIKQTEYLNYFIEIDTYLECLPELVPMLLGMIIFKLGWLTNSNRKRNVRLTIVGLGLGLGCSLYNMTNHPVTVNDLNWFMEHVSTLRVYLYKFTNPLVTLGLIGLILLFYSSNSFNKLKNTLASTGKMAFTNYLMQSLICGFIFNGYGIGLYGQLERYQLYFIVLLVWIINISFSVWWLKRYSLGPMEWIWRMLTYWKRIPIRR
jgi:uncharacterized protein